MCGCWGGGEEPEDGRRMRGVPLPTVPLKFIMKVFRVRLFYTVLFAFKEVKVVTIKGDRVTRWA